MSKTQSCKIRLSDLQRKIINEVAAREGKHFSEFAGDCMSTIAFMRVCETQQFSIKESDFEKISQDIMLENYVGK